MKRLDKSTTDHAEIRHWVEEHDGRPAIPVDASERMVRIIFPDIGINDQLEEISWNEFFETFEEEDLAFEYKEDIEEGEEITAFRFIHREEN